MKATLPQYTACLLRQTALDNGLRLRFAKVGRLWECHDFKGNLMWCGSLAEMRKIAKGEA